MARRTFSGRAKNAETSLFYKNVKSQVSGNVMQNVTLRCGSMYLIIYITAIFQQFLLYITMAMMLTMIMMMMMILMTQQL